MKLGRQDQRTGSRPIWGDAGLWPAAGLFMRPGGGRSQCCPLGRGGNSGYVRGPQVGVGFWFPRREGGGRGRGQAAASSGRWIQLVSQMGFIPGDQDRRYGANSNKIIGSTFPKTPFKVGIDPIKPKIGGHISKVGRVGAPAFYFICTPGSKCSFPCD